MHLPVDPGQRGPAGQRSRVSLEPGKHSAQHDEGVRESFAVDLRTWILDEHAAGLARFDQAVAPHVPVDRWRETAGEGGASIAWLVFHLSYHQDLAVRTAVLGQPPILTEWRPVLGLDGAAPHDGLGEAEQPEVAAALVVTQLTGYARHVHEATQVWLRDADLALLDTVPPAGERMAGLADVTEDAVPWLHAMWRDKPGGWFVQWEAVGHVHNHVGEMISVRSRLGLSPF